MADITYSRDYDLTKSKVLQVTKDIHELDAIKEEIENTIHTCEELPNLNDFARKALPIIKEISDVMTNIQDVWEPWIGVFNISFDVFEEAGKTGVGSQMHS